MNKIRIICENCKTKMDSNSLSSFTKKDDAKEIWTCPKCNLEVFVLYANDIR